MGYLHSRVAAAQPLDHLCSCNGVGHHACLQRSSVAPTLEHTWHW
jgi:hypothetical protein